MLSNIRSVNLPEILFNFIKDLESSFPFIYVFFIGIIILISVKGMFFFFPKGYFILIRKENMI